MKNRNLILSLIILIISSCNNEKRLIKQKNDKQIDKILVVQDLQSKVLLNKKVLSLSKVLGDSVDITNKVFMLYNGFDCSNCIDIGFNLIKNIDSISKRKVCYVIGNQTNFHQEQSRNNYLDFIYKDNKDLIRRELKFVKTPLLMYFNSERKITKVLFPNYIRTEKVLKKENRFCDFVVKEINSKKNGL